MTRQDPSNPDCPARKAPTCTPLARNLSHTNNVGATMSLSQNSRPQTGQGTKQYRASAISKYTHTPRPLCFVAKRVRIDVSIEGKIPEATIDTAADVPCISAKFIQSHPILSSRGIHPIPPPAINLRSADGSALTSTRFTRFSLTIGDITKPVEALVLPTLGPDPLLLDNSITSAFGAALRWDSETLTFRQSPTAIHGLRRTATRDKPEGINHAPYSGSVATVEQSTQHQSRPVKNVKSYPDMKWPSQCSAQARPLRKQKH